MFGYAACSVGDRLWRGPLFNGTVANQASKGVQMGTADIGDKLSFAVALGAGSAWRRRGSHGSVATEPSRRLSKRWDMFGRFLYQTRPSDFPNVSSNSREGRRHVCAKCIIDNALHHLKRTQCPILDPKNARIGTFWEHRRNWAVATGECFKKCFTMFHRDRDYSTVTLLARLRGLSTLQPRSRAAW
jgi:hypothetical protein